MTITLGTPVTRPELTEPFSGLSPLNQCIDVTTDLAAYIYLDDAAGLHKARAVSVNSLTISSVSSGVTVIGESVSGVTVTLGRLNSSHFMIGWANFDLSPDFTNIRVQICHVGPTVVTPGPVQTLVTRTGLTTGPAETAIIRVSDSLGVMVYTDNDTLELFATAFTVVGSAIGSTGTPVVIGSHADEISGHTLWDGQHAVIGFRRGGVFAQILSVVGTTVTFGTPVQFQSESLNQATRIVGMTPTRGAIFSNRLVGAISLRSWGRQFEISGTVITPIGLTVDYGSSLDRGVNRGAVRLSDDVGVLNYRDGNGIAEHVTEFTVGATLSVFQVALVLVAPAPSNSNMGVAPLGDNRMLVMYDVDQLAVAATDEIIPPVAAETGFFLLSVMPSREGIHVWCTTWENDFLQLRRLNTDTMFYDRIYFLGPATFTEVSTRVRLAFVFAITDDHVFIYGSMSAPGGLAGDQHIIELDEAVDNEFNSIVSTWGSDLAAAVHVGHLNGLNRKYFAIREAALNPPQLQWNEGASPVFDTISVLPFDAADVLTHRAIDYNSGLDQLAIAARFRGVAPIAVIGNGPYSSWTDITEDFPLGADIKVAKYLAGNG